MDAAPPEGRSMTRQPDSAERCQTCRFWERSTFQTGVATIGTCRRYAPRGPLALPYGPAGDLAEVQTFPVTNDDDWCGEYVARES